MAKGKTKIIFVDETGKETAVYVDSLLKDKKYKIIVKEEGAPRHELADYIANGAITPPEPEPTPTPICEGHSHWDGEKCVCDPGYKDDGQGNCVEDVITPPDPNPEPNPEGLLYDSNRMGHWDDGNARVVPKGGHDGSIAPDGKGLYTAASGSPQFRIDGKGVGRLVTQPGFGRIYIKAKNRNSRLEMEFNIESSSVDNLSLKLRSRHQEGNAESFRAGGEGWAISTKDWDSKRENFHNNHTQNGSGKLSKQLQNGQWYKLKFTCKDESSSQIRLIGEIDYGDGNFVKEMDLVDKNPPAYFFDDSLLNKDSYYWIRLNGSGSVALKNVKLVAV